MYTLVFSFVCVQVLTKQEAGEEMAAILEECKVGRKKIEEDVISWKKRLVCVCV